uniref:Uncharacterized protein n=1 Tax=Craspedostauros australis TaxID=1486917 RepID=A0A7R9ZP41_9STRA|mmetsp:Transcript_21347/g.59347  ORF Transcript_21347/g.59347 Transcript_21347/m.59347 type:complete len:210 (+) Transcript_21347:80-709(+)
MKLAIAALLAGSAAAFAPSQSAKTTSALQVSELELGVTEPLGVFDPLGWLETEPEAFERRRAVERKHGRIAMMAMLGTFVHNNKWTFDGYLSPSNNIKFTDIDSGIGGLFQVPAAGLAQIILVAGFIELTWWPASKLDGDYGVRLGKINNWEQEPGKEIRQKNAELNNGRAAMAAISGIFVQEVLTGQNLYEQATSGHWSPFGDGQGFF